jgi:flagellar basal-body rod protein FlgB
MSQDLVIMKALTEKMDWHEQRQKTIAQNIANADTPNYTPQDLTPLNFKEILSSSASKLPLTGAGLATTDPKHISSQGGSSVSATVKEKSEKKPYETSPSGNSVVLEEQMIKMNQNVADHEFMLNLYQKQVQMLKASAK